MVCNQVKGGYCTSKTRNGFCRRNLMMCGDDSVLFMDDFTKFKLNKKIYQEVEIKNEI